MAEAKKITAANIKKLWYGETSEISTDLTGQALHTLLQGETLKEIKNIHQDTWTIEEAEASRTNYKNQLTNQTYRSDKEMGDVTVNFTIGEYDYVTKKDLMGGDIINTDKGWKRARGDIINTDKGWKRARGKVNIEKLLVALTDDDQYCVIPRADIGAREATTDKAVGIPVSAVELEPQNTEVAPEYWFDSSEVTAGV